MKKTFIFMLFFGCMAINVQAQLRHYFSCNTLVYVNTFNKEADRVNWLFPSLSYKVEKGGHGLEAYFTHYYGYHKEEYGKTEVGDLTEIYLRTAGINYQYKFLQLRNLELNVLAGLTINMNRYNYLIAWSVMPPWYESHVDGNPEFTIGTQTGLNLNVPIWMGIYANGNLRYSLNPFVKNSFFRHNMMIEVGIGYKLQRKTKT